nr:Mur ligase family protein [Candidatus Gracilibacteria bacterium]
MIKTYEEAKNKIFTHDDLADYELGKMINAMIFLENPLKNIKVIHIAGTNGKGSVSKMVFSILKNAGKKVGVFTQPHLIDVKERFLTDEGYINEKEFIELTNRLTYIPIKLAQFEKGTLLAFEFFKERNVEYAIIEVGLGGRLDATNVVEPTITCITSISLDHQNILGDTLEKISFEKAGIIKSGIPVIINQQNKVIEDIAKEKKSKLIFTTKKVKTNMLGDFQERNAGLAYEICKYLGINEETILKGLQCVKHNGRLQYLNKNILVDGAHNEGGLKELKIYIDSIKDNFKKINFCFSLKKGKNINLITDIFGIKNNYIIIDSQNMYLENTKILQKQFLEKGKKVEILDKDDILELASKKEDELFMIFGSLYMIGDFLEFK